MGGSSQAESSCMARHARKVNRVALRIQVRPGFLYLYVFCNHDHHQEAPARAGMEYLPVDRRGADLLFQVVAARCEAGD